MLDGCFKQYWISLYVSFEVGIFKIMENKFRLKFKLSFFKLIITSRVTLFLVKFLTWTNNERSFAFTNHILVYVLMLVHSVSKSLHPKSKLCHFWLGTTW